MKEYIKNTLNKMSADGYKCMQYNLATLANLLVILNYSNFNYTHEFSYPLYITTCVSSSALYLTDYLISKSDGMMYTKDYKDIRPIYDKIIKNYTKLNKEFNFKNPLEVYSTYIFMLNNGYLSNGKSFEHYDDRNNVKERFGLNVINGRGVCRHIAALLNDEFKDLGLESSVAGVSLPTCYIEADEDKFNKMVDDAINGIIPSEIDKEFVRSVFKYEKKLFLPLLNHDMNFVFYDGINYFLDPTNNMTFHLNKDDCKLHSIDYEAKFIKFQRESFRESLKLKRYMYNKPFLDFDSENEIISRTTSICEENEDIFEKFYDENKDYYNDISKRLAKIR